MSSNFYMSNHPLAHSDPNLRNEPSGRKLYKVREYAGLDCYDYFFDTRDDMELFRTQMEKSAAVTEIFVNNRLCLEVKFPRKVC